MTKVYTSLLTGVSENKNAKYHLFFSPAFSHNTLDPIIKLISITRMQNLISKDYKEEERNIPCVTLYHSEIQ